jgi:hypothetical protein
MRSERKSKSGRSEKTGWRDLSVILGAYILKHCETSREHIKIEEASKTIYDIAKNAGIRDLPAASTIKGVISHIRSKATTLEIS